LSAQEKKKFKKDLGSFAEKGEEIYVLDEFPKVW